MTTSYETMIGVMGFAGAAICAYLSTSIGSIKEPFKTSLQLLFLIFSLFFIMSGFGSGVQMATNQTGETSALTTSVATGYKASVILTILTVFIVTLFFLWNFLNYLGGLGERVKKIKIIPKRGLYKRRME